MKILNQTVLALCLFTTSQAIWTTNSDNNTYLTMVKALQCDSMQAAIPQGYCMHRDYDLHATQAAVNELSIDPEIRQFCPNLPILSSESTLIIKDGYGNICGYANHHRQQPKIHILMVDPKHRHNGLATALISTMENYYAQRGHTSITLHVDAQNSIAIKLYQKHGFIAVTPKECAPKPTSHL